MTWRAPLFLFSLLGLPLALACSDGSTPTDVGPASAAQLSALAGGRVAFGFNGTASGFPTGAVRLTGGGSYDPATASNTVPAVTSVASSGGFDCTEPVSQGLLAGCLKDEGVRWDTAQLLESTPFKCSADDTPRLAVTGARRAVLLADFYRAGNGNHESFTAPMIISDTDLAPDILGDQTLWVQGVGCGTANQHFNGPAE
jgi:hypothetical protein